MTPAGLASLERVLKAYAAADPEVNYCQARLLGVWASHRPFVKPCILGLVKHISPCV